MTMSSMTDYCILCHADMKKSNKSLTQIENKGGIQNGAKIDLLTLCDILRVSVNAAENYLAKKVSLCGDCDNNIWDIRKLLGDLKMIKQNISKTMQVVKEKLDGSLTSVDSQEDPLTQFDHIRHEILYDLSIILGIKSEYSIVPVKNQEFDISDCEDNDNNVYEGIKAESDPQNDITPAEGELPQTEETTNAIKKILRSSSALPTEKNQSSATSASDSVQENGPVDANGDSSDEQDSFTERDSFDPDFSANSSSDSEGSDEENTSKRKSTTKSPDICLSFKGKPDEIDDASKNSDTSLNIQNKEKTEILKRIPKRQKPRTPKTVQKPKIPKTLQKKTGGSQAQRYSRCPICEKYFYRGTVNRHMRSAHVEGGQLKKLKCEDCGKMFKTKQGYRLHVVIHEELFMPYVCSYCGKEFKNKVAIARHEKLHIQGKIYECDVCHKKWDSKYKLLAHVEVHSTELKYTCDLCGKNFKLLKTFKCHKRRHLETAEGRDTTVDCTYCQKQFKNRQSLRGHLVRYHLSNTVVHKCKYCGKIFTRADHLRRHEKNHQEHHETVA